MAVTLSEVIKSIEEIYPKALAEQWDNVGLQVGDSLKFINRILISLDITERVVEDAIEQGADLIITHHPLIFKPLKNLDLSCFPGNIVKKLVKHNIALYSAHTNLDKAELGLNHMAARILGVKEYKVLAVTEHTPLKKVVVYVPKGYEDNVRNAMAQEGAGFIGNYSHCTFQSQGTGTFLAQEGTEPFIGTQGKLEYAEEYRLETIVPLPKLSAVLSAMTKAHPYEEAAYDIYSLDNKGSQIGIGMIYNLEKEITLEQYAKEIRARFDCQFLRLVGDNQKKVSKIGFCSGSGKDYLREAVKMGCHLLITGDVDHHTALDALSFGISLIDPGHHATEKIMVEGLIDVLSNRLSKDIEYLKSNINTQPFIIMKE
jgi:dinuclear metal center YbgI/SA1388 family protein